MRKVLLIRFSALGDVAMLAPVVREAAKANPDVEFTVLSRPMCRPLFEELSENVRFRGAEVKKGEYHSLRGLYKLFRELNEEHYDTVCDMHDVLRTKVLRKLFRLHGYKVCKIDKHRELRRVITAQGDRKQLRQLPTAFENYRQVLLDAGLRNTSLRNETEDFCETKQKTSTKRTTSYDKSSIGIAPFAAHAGKIYPLERMEKVVAAISGKQSMEIYLFSGPGEERKLMKEWAARYPGVTVAADVCSNLSEELQLMKTLSVMLTMDSANMHLASLAGTRVVSIWGATHPFAGFLGWQQNIDDCIQRSDLACRPCSIYGNKPCLRGDMECMNITTEKILFKLTIEN